MNAHIQTKRTAAREIWGLWLAALLALALVACALAVPAPARAAVGRGTLTLAGTIPGETFGCSVASAGDLNGDGYADVIVGAYQSGTAVNPAGRAYIYFGGPRATGARPDLVLSGEAPNDAFGVSVAGAGDVNRDGFADVIVGAYENDARGANAGRAYIFFGGPAMDTKPDVVLTGEAAGDAFGYAVAGVGDVNKDGFADVVVGAYENSARGAGAGRAYLYYGGAAPHTTPDLMLNGESVGDRYGISVAGAGDVNGDGFADFVVGAYQNDAGGIDAGRAYVYFGGPRLTDRANVTLTGAAPGDAFGFSVGGAGDVNKDGFDDVIVGAYHNNAGGKDAGRAYVYNGGRTISEEPSAVYTGEAAGDAFGYAVGSAGDSNGDGFDDVIVGAYGNDAGGSAAGRTYVFFGGATPDAAADWFLTGDQSLDNLGFAVSGAGDVDKDGYADVVVGAPYSDAGRAYISKTVGGKSRPVAAR